MSISDPDAHLVQAFDEQTNEVVNLDRFVRLARHVLGAERFGIDAELTLVFVDEETMSEYHERFLDEPGPTDVMAFPMDTDMVLGDMPVSGRSPDNGDNGPGSPNSDDSEPPAILGDVMVCPAFAARQARERGIDLEAELSLLVVHGVLHLLNYDHAEPSEEALMQARQTELLREFALSESGSDDDDGKASG